MTLTDRRIRYFLQNFVPIDKDKCWIWPIAYNERDKGFKDQMDKAYFRPCEVSYMLHYELTLIHKPIYHTCPNHRYCINPWHMYLEQPLYDIVDGKIVTPIPEIKEPIDVLAKYAHLGVRHIPARGKQKVQR